MDTELKDVKQVECKNHASSTKPDRRDKVEKLLTEEILLGHYVVVDDKPMIINAIGAVDKPGSDEV